MYVHRGAQYVGTNKPCWGNARHFLCTESFRANPVSLRSRNIYLSSDVNGTSSVMQPASLHSSKVIFDNLQISEICLNLALFATFCSRCLHARPLGKWHLHQLFPHPLTIPSQQPMVAGSHSRPPGPHASARPILQRC